MLEDAEEFDLGRPTESVIDKTFDIFDLHKSIADKKNEVAPYLLNYKRTDQHFLPVTSS